MVAVGALVAFAAFVIVLWAIHLAGWLSHEVTYLLLIAGGLWWYALRLYHKRRMAAINELEYAKGGRFRRVHAMFRWPKYCAWCAMSLPTPKQAAIHNREDSHCSHHQLVTLAAADKALEADAEYRLTVEDGSQRRYHGARPEVTTAHTDTLSGADREGIEA